MVKKHVCKPLRSSGSPSTVRSGYGSGGGCRPVLKQQKPRPVQVKSVTMGQETMADNSSMIHFLKASPPPSMQR